MNVIMHDRIFTVERCYLYFYQFNSLIWAAFLESISSKIPIMTDKTSFKSTGGLIFEFSVSVFLHIK